MPEPLIRGPLLLVRRWLEGRGLSVSVWDDAGPRAQVEAWEGWPRGEFGRICVRGSVQRIGNWRKQDESDQSPVE